MDRVITDIPKHLGATPCSQSLHLHRILLHILSYTSCLPLHSQLVTIRAGNLSRTSMGNPAAMDSRVAMVNKAAMGRSLPLVTPLRLDPTARLQVNIANRAAAMGSRVHSDRTTPHGVWGRSLEDFPDQERTGA